ncbi:glycine cleavage system aminomethyltransferase GcvT [Roseomonas sp. OT10]|uniref:glycine cleavage system aminomethyltransferase GcvT n=1 Tax=Roseomonas cutis TaxID=2897332 RepID=UPI001E34E013|nr:glycine cleavage system aminomethyltransferase GcvT [Roseomonas sp. OT10]UFN46828.1 glycine cleavage system aminomethyltransferase GcvT [Roseomonas sp. OT10]
MADTETLLDTPLAAWHQAQGARMVPFAGYRMPVQYPSGIIAEHAACRTGAALFDVSHMGQAELLGEAGAAVLETLTPAEVQGLKPGRQRYGVLMTEAGGILDDFMVARLGPERLFLVLNASRKHLDEAAIAAILPAAVTLRPLRDRALLAVQGPGAEAALATLAPEVATLPFMGVAEVTLAGHPALVSRSGYTGEDGYEIGLPAEGAVPLADALLAAGVVPAGLGARDSLRLEAGLCLYGNDLDETTSPVEANLVWTIGKRRRMDWDFRGAGRVRAELDHGPARLRVGLAVEGRQPARAHTPIVIGGETVGEVTSGSFGPTLGAPVAMGYVRRAAARDGTAVELPVRGKPIAARIAPMPFVPHRYRRGTAAA